MKPARKIKLAIFDIDGTIFRSSLVIELINGLVERKVFPKKAKKETEKEYVAWLDRKGSYEDYIRKVVRIYVKYIAGVKVSRALDAADRVIAVHKDRLYRYTRDLIEKLKKQNYFLIAISGSPIYIVEKFAEVAGFNASFGTIIEIKDGRFTKKVLDLSSAYHKDKILKSFVAKMGNKADLKESLAVGDTESDIAVLKMVGCPIAFNPNLQLGQYAIKKNWRVVVERKDIIYDLKDFDFVRHSR